MLLLLLLDFRQLLKLELQGDCKQLLLDSFGQNRCCRAQARPANKASTTSCLLLDNSPLLDRAARYTVLRMSQ
jgi:hypothetical protein